jgi:3-isopropylmalate dehydrogenase
MSHRILLLPGDGIGPEVVEQARRVLVATAGVFDLDLVFDSADLGGVAIDRQSKGLSAACWRFAPI